MSLMKHKSNESNKKFKKLVTSGKMPYFDKNGRPVSPRVAGVHVYHAGVDDSRFRRESEGVDGVDYESYDTRKQKTNSKVLKRPVRKVVKRKR
jgi:hypothetical protein